MLHAHHDFLSSGEKDLTKILAETLKTVERLSGEVKIMEKEIAEFNKYYYAEVGELFEQLQRLKKPAPAMASQPAASKVKRTMPKLETASVMAQKIYRRLAKCSHPDTQKNTRADFFIELNEAYQQKNLHKLMLLEQEWQKKEKLPESKFEAVRRVETWLDSAQAAHDYLEERRETLEQSPAYILRQKIYWAKLSGENLMEDIKRNMRHQIAELSAEFIAA